jgi:vitamin B12 transporter
MMIASLRPAAAAALACACAGAFAQASLPAAFVTATRTPQQLAAVLSDVRVIDADTIARSGSATLAELLQAHGGMEIASNGGPGQLASVFVRGANANHVVVLIDGVRVNSATAGTNSFEVVPLAQIERIEVLRGPASSLYGADAVGGVIQIFTRQGTPRTTARIGAGSWRTGELSAGIARAFGDTTLSVQAGASETRGFSATNAREPTFFDPDDDGYRNRNLGLHLGHRIADGHALALRLLHSDGVAHFDDAVFPPPDFLPTPVDSRNRLRVSTVALESRNRLAADWSSLLRVARGSDRRHTEQPATATSFRFDTDQDQLTWQNDFGALGGRWAAGFEWRRERVSSDTAFDRTSRRIASAFASYAATLDAHLLQASLRRDDNSQFGAQNTGNLAYGFQLSPALRLSAGLGSAFKAPTFNDLYFPGFGNADLEPEKATSAEAGARYDDGQVDASLTVFRNRIRDLIQFDFASSLPMNVATARNRGITLGAGTRRGAWRASAEYTRQQPVNADTDEPLPRRARHHATAGLAYDAQPWRGGVEWVASTARFDSGTPRPRLGGYALLNLHAAYALSPTLTVSARLNNATDKAYELVRGFNTPARNVFVALDYTAK